MKQLIALFFCLILLIPASIFAEEVEISLWTYPIGGWGSEESVRPIIDAFNAVHPEITISVRYLDYTSGDDLVAAAIDSDTMPDIIMEGPERLVANWSTTGKMLDISDLWDDTVTSDIVAASPAVEAACRNAEGVYYEYPLCMTTHCMVINYNDFEAAGALQYIDELTHTWTTDDFISALDALVAAGFSPTGIVYCGGQGGDQGTRALVTNLYSDHFTNEAHTAYTMGDEGNLKALHLLQNLVHEGKLEAGPDFVAADEISLFCDSTLSLCFCWNASAALSNKASLAEDVRVFPMAFPSDDGFPELQSGIWGFGLFDHGDATRAAAAKEFVKFVCDDPVQAKESVFISGFFPTRFSLGDIYAGTDKEENGEYAIFTPLLGDYYQVTKNWAEQRTEWWNLLKRIFAGGDVETEVAVYLDHVNQ